MSFVYGEVWGQNVVSKFIFLSCLFIKLEQSVYFVEKELFKRVFRVLSNIWIPSLTVWIFSFYKMITTTVSVSLQTHRSGGQGKLVIFSSMLLCTSPMFIEQSFKQTISFPKLTKHQIFEKFFVKKHWETISVSYIFRSLVHCKRTRCGNFTTATKSCTMGNVPCLILTFNRYMFIGIIYI